VYLFLQGYERTWAYAAGAAVWMPTGDLARRVFHGVGTPPATLLPRAVLMGAIGGLFGFVMDHYNWARPEKPPELKQEALVQAIQEFEESKKANPSTK
jgi:hypothetical protein